MGWHLSRFSWVLGLPIARAVMTEQKRPIHSLLEDEPRLQEEISEFVIGLAEAIDGLQDAHSEGDLESLDRLAAELGARAIRYGYPPLAAISAAVQAACRDENPDAARKAVEEATEIARRIRLGHRGAA